MSPIKANLQHIQHEIAKATNVALPMATVNSARHVSLIAVSKTKPSAMIREAFDAGQRLFGENYVQEAVTKITELSDLRVQGIEWHFIGPLQSNKAKLVAQYFDWVHGVDRLKIAEALAKNRAELANLAPLNVCVQINVSGEASKSGVLPSEVINLAKQITALPALKLRGLMTIIENTLDETTQRAQFGMMRKLQQQLIGEGVEMDTLSMGMSQDFRVAIEEGATMVRIGSAIFGERERIKI
jgi:PLP dependent protein